MATQSSIAKHSWGALLPIGLTLLISILLQRLVLSQPEQIAQWIEQYGWYGIGVYILIQSLTIIIAPLGGMFMQVALVGFYGAFWASVFVYLVTTPLYLINFAIARRYGRPWVKRLIGSSSMDQVDQLTTQLGARIVTWLRIAQGNFDFVAYAAGLTNLPFKQFFWINGIAGVGGALGFYAIFSWAPSLTYGVIGIYLVSVVMVSAIIFMAKKKPKSL